MIQTRYFVYEDYNDYKLHYCSDISILTKDNISPLLEGSSEEECEEFIDARKRVENIRKVEKLTSSNGYEFMFNSEINMWECTKRPEYEVKTNTEMVQNPEMEPVFPEIKKDANAAYERLSKTLKEKPKPIFSKEPVKSADEAVVEELKQKYSVSPDIYTERRLADVLKENNEKYLDTLSKKLSDIRSIVSLNSEAITSDAKIALIIEVLK